MSDVRHQTGSAVLLQNTVNPWSGLLRDRSRIATFMGNRGVIHDQSREIKPKAWVGKRWICCAKEFKGIDRRPLFKTDPFSYTELFFLDEATAYSAGHRPCNDCRNADLSKFKQFWAEAFGALTPGVRLTVGEIDSQLHRERIGANGSKGTYSANRNSLPLGVMFAYGGQAYLVRRHGVRLWTTSGYLPANVPQGAEVEVLTPKSIVQLIKLGLPVQVHSSADA